MWRAAEVSCISLNEARAAHHSADTVISQSVASSDLHKSSLSSQNELLRCYKSKDPAGSHLGRPPSIDSPGRPLRRAAYSACQVASFQFEQLLLFRVLCEITLKYKLASFYSFISFLIFPRISMIAFNIIILKILTLLLFLISLQCATNCS